MRSVLVLVLCSGCYLVDLDPDEDCVPRSCAEQGFDCGQADDGCGGPLECGTCGDLFTCGAGGSPNVCYCPPVGCQEQLATCGPVPDGCGGTLECGPCGGAALCGEGGDPNVCALPADAVHCDPDTGFCWQNPHPVPFEPFDAFARAPDDIWAVGYRGQIRRFDGVRWSVVDSGTDVLLRGVWAAGENDAWAAGLGGTLLHWDGAAWSPVDLGTAVDLTDVRGTSAGNVWVIGTGVSFRWNGATWSPAAASTPVLYHLWVADATHAWATGGGRVWEWAPEGWIARTVADDSLTLNGIAGLPTGEVIAVGYDDNSEITDPWDKDELVYRHAGGATWTRWDTPDEGPVDGGYATADQIVALRGEALSVLVGPPIPSQPPGGRAVGAGVGADHVILGAQGGPVRLTGGVWLDDRHGSSEELRPAGRVGSAVWFSAGNRLFAWLGGGLVETVPAPSDLMSLSGSSESEVIAIAGGQLHAFDGQSWTPIDGGPTDLVALERDGDDLLAAGAALSRRTAAGWQSEHESAGSMWRDVAVDGDGSVWAAGAREGAAGSTALVAHATAEGWNEMEVPGATTLCSILVLGPDNVWVGGSAGFTAPAVLSHWNGSQWQTEEVGYGEACDLLKPTEGGLLAVIGGELWQRKAGSWVRWLSNPLGSFNGLAADSEGGLWLAGSAGAILHRR